MITIDYNNAQLVDVLDCSGEARLCWIDRESGDVLREFDETNLEITSDYIEIWDAGREAVVGAWIGETGEILETVDETTREAENDLTLDDDFAFVF